MSYRKKIMPHKVTGMIGNIIFKCQINYVQFPTMLSSCIHFRQLIISRTRWKQKIKGDLSCFYLRLN